MTKLEVFFLGIIFLLTCAVVLFLYEYITTINAMYAKMQAIWDYTRIVKP